jgi:hypothetical protein
MARVIDMSLYQPKKLHNFSLTNEGDIWNLSEAMQLLDALHIQTAMEHQTVILQDIWVPPPLTIRQVTTFLSLIKVGDPGYHRMS